MARGVVMDLKGDKMNWAMYAKWTNRKQQRKKGSIIELLSDGEGDTEFPNDEGTQVRSGGCSSIVLEQITQYLEFLK